MSTITTEQWSEIIARFAACHGPNTDTWLRNAFPIHWTPETRILTIAFDTQFKANYVTHNFIEGEGGSRSIANIAAKVLEIVDPVDASNTQSLTVNTIVLTQREFENQSRIFHGVVDPGTKQLDMFATNISEVSIKDDVHLMEIAPFSLNRRGETRSELVYENIKGMNIRIEANPKFGLPSHADYDIVLLVQSQLAARANRWRTQMETWSKIAANDPAAKRPDPPPRHLVLTNKDLQLFAELENGGKRRSEFRDQIKRLENTRVYISAATSPQKRRYGSFPLVGETEIIEQSATGQIIKVRIGIPDWMYRGIVTVGAMSILTYEDGYMRLKKPLYRFLYRLCRLYDRSLETKNELRFALKDIHYRSGSRNSPKEFNRELADELKTLAAAGFFRWTLTIEGEVRDRYLVIRRQANIAPELLNDDCMPIGLDPSELDPQQPPEIIANKPAEDLIVSG